MRGVRRCKFQGYIARWACPRYSCGDAFNDQIADVDIAGDWKYFIDGKKGLLAGSQIRMEKAAVPNNASRRRCISSAHHSRSDTGPVSSCHERTKFIASFRTVYCTLYREAYSSSCSSLEDMLTIDHEEPIIRTPCCRRSVPLA